MCGICVSRISSAPETFSYEIPKFNCQDFTHGLLLVTLPGNAYCSRSRDDHQSSLIAETMTSTPTTSGPSEAELRSFVDVPKPFKSSASGKNANRRNRNLKQILAAERDAAMGIDPSMKKSKSGGAGTAGGRKMLTGAAAAAAAARRREDLMMNSAAPSGTATPAELDGGDISAAMTDIDMDTLTASALGTDGTQTPANIGSEAIKRRLLPSYASIEAPPSLRPRKKFCDITGLVAPYTDPKTGLRYHSVEMYEVIKTFGPGVDQSYLTLRGDNSLIK